jgi:hypothetical protein
LVLLLITQVVEVRVVMLVIRMLVKRVVQEVEVQEQLHLAQLQEL